MGADRIVVHSGAAGKGERRQALLNSKKTLKLALSRMDDEGFGHISLCPETMGKINQLGTLQEVLELCLLDERLIPCVDFGHLYARQHGELDFKGVLDEMEKTVGFSRASTMHVHFSKIEFSKGGEVRHLNFEDEGFGPCFEPLGKLFCGRGYSPRVICESAGNQADDALSMKKSYREAAEHSGL
jgi:deoxyribonuclease-4